uniref:Non-specific serine/threonine protein kinase n=1 Tax=Heligmosomoides polygyrus TaxID=6339 RepID=A0A183GHW8_HELPZ
LEAASSLGPDASGVFLTVLEIVGDLVSHHTKFPSTASVAFLSLPWLMDPELQLQSKRHMTSLPLLKEMNRLAKTSAVSASDDVLEYTLSALSSVHGFCDWRRTILLAAMSSQRPVLVQYSNVDVSCVLNALSHSLCASHPASEVHGASGVTCKACEQLVSGTAVPDQEKVQQLPGLFELLIQVLTDSRYQTEKHIRLDAAALVLTALCHMQCPPDVYLRVVKASLSFINDQDEDVRNVFQSAFKVIVSGTLPSELAEAIFAEFSAGYPAEFEQTMVEASNPFLVVATRNSSCPDLSNRCLHQLFIRALRLLDSTAFCTDLVNEMLYSWREEDGGDEVINDGIDDLLQVARKVFGFDNVPSFIRASVYIVPYILLSDVEQRPIAVKVLERLRFHMSKHRQDLISEYFPSLLERPLEPAKRKSLKTFIKEYCDLDLRYLFHTKRFLCIVYVLRSIALDEQGYLEILQSMRSNSSREPFSLTAVMKFNCEYLGFLLSFRRSLLDDDHYEQRSVLLPSLATIIRLIDEKFLEDTSNKVMVVLRAATTLGESSVAVWNEFVRRLSDGMLATLLPKILIAIQPLLKYSDTNDLLDNIFARRKPLEIEQSEAFERTAMVLVNSEAGDSSRINFHLRRTCTDNSIENIVSGKSLEEGLEEVVGWLMESLRSEVLSIPGLAHLVVYHSA